MKKIRKQLTIITLTLAFILVFSGTVSAASWDVGPTYTYQTIQNAIDNSNTLDGDVINVYPNGTGAYTENVIVNKNLTLKANSSGTVVNGSFTITSAGSGSTINGFTINKAPVQTPIFSENFDSVTAPTLPSGWAVQKTGGSEGNWATNVGTKHPSGQLAHSGSNLAYFNSWDAYSGNSARLYRTSGLDLSGLSSAQVSFWMYHDTGWSGYDSVMLQISTNGGINWYSVGPAIYRYDGSTGWKEHTLDISSYTGPGMNNVRIGFDGYSNWGNDCHIDDITVKSGTVPATNGIYLNSASGCTITGNTINGFENGNGIYLSSANGNTITGNTITNCINGINLYGSNNNLISGNNVSNNSNIGIFIQEISTGNNIINNIADNNGHGIYLNRFCDNNNIEGNTVTNSILDGITMGASTGNTIKNNIMAYNGRYGFWSNYYGNNITGNNIFNNYNGIGLYNYMGNYLSETFHFNRIFNNTNWNLNNTGTSAAFGTPNATYNWWGTNSQSAIAAKINGLATYSPWLFMTINANPNPINNGETSLITVSFNNYSSDGTTYTPFDPATGHIPDGTPVAFNAERSIGGSSTTSGGVATATFTADGAPGEADVNAVTDSQTVNTSVMINSKSSLYLTVIPSNTNPVAGDTVVYTLKVGNNGPDTAENVVMTYVVPEGLEFVTASDDTGNTWSYDENTRTITWNLGSVPKGDPNLWLTLRVAQAGQYLINPILSTSSYDPTLNNNVQTFAFIATAVPDDDQPDTNDTDDETTNNTVNAATNTTSTVGMQETGLPLAGLVLAIFAVFAGLATSKRK